MPKIDKKISLTSLESLSGSRETSLSSVVNSSAKSYSTRNLSEESDEISINVLDDNFLSKIQKMQTLPEISRFINLDLIWARYKKIKMIDSNYQDLYELVDKLNKTLTFYELKPEFEQSVKSKSPDGIDNLSRYKISKPKDEGREVGVLVVKKSKSERSYMVKEYTYKFEAINEVLVSSGMRALLGDVIPKNKIIKSHDGRVLVFSRMLSGFETIDSLYSKKLSQKEILLHAAKEIEGFMDLKAAHLLFGNLDDHLFNDGIIEVEGGERIAASVDFGRAMALKYDSELMDMYEQLSLKYSDGEAIDPIDILRVKTGPHYKFPSEFFIDMRYIAALRRICECYESNKNQFYEAINSGLRNIIHNLDPNEVRRYALFIGDSENLRESFAKAMDERVIKIRELADNLELELEFINKDEELLITLVSKTELLSKKFSWLSSVNKYSLADAAVETIQTTIEENCNFKSALYALKVISIVPTYLLQISTTSIEDFHSNDLKENLVNLLYLAMSKFTPDCKDKSTLVFEELKTDGFVSQQEIRSFVVPQSLGRRKCTDEVAKEVSVLDKLSNAFSDSPFENRFNALNSIMLFSLNLGLNSKQIGSKWVEGSIQSFINFLASNNPKSKTQAILKWREAIGLTDEKLKLVSSYVERTR